MKISYLIKSDLIKMCYNILSGYYSNEEKEEIKKSIENEFAKNIYKNIFFDFEQIESIEDGLKDHIDVSLYANPEYSVSQMEEIRLGLLAGLDVSDYANETSMTSISVCKT